MTQVQQTQTTEPLQATTLVRQRSLVQRLINQLHKTRVPVSVSPSPSTEECYSSSVLGLEHGDEGALVLDELNPRDGHNRLLETKRLQVYGLLNGLSVRFDTELISSQEHDGRYIYRVKVPTVIEHGQQRAFYRVHVGLGRNLPVSIEPATSARVDGELRDLSIGGICAAFPSGTPIEPEMDIAACRIELPGSEPVTCALKVRYTVVDTSHQELRIGASFVGLTQAQTKLVQRCIHTLERDEIRKKGRSSP